MADEEKKSGALAAFMNSGAVAALDPEAQAGALLDSANDGASGDGDVVYLSFSGKMDKYVIGRDKEQPDPDAVYVVDPLSVMEGWICWKGGSPVEKHAWSVYSRAEKAIPRSQLTDHGPYGEGDGWNEVMGFSMFDVDDPSQRIEFTTSSKSGRNAFADLNKEMAQRLVDGEPHVPVIQLASEKFTAQGKINGKPKFIFEGWVTVAEVQAFIEAGDDGDVEDLLSGAYEAAEEPEPEPEPEPKPKKTRSRKAPARRKAS
jgi:hypothetical protein